MSLTTTGLGPSFCFAFAACMHDVIILYLDDVIVDVIVVVVAVVVDPFFQPQEYFAFP